MPTELNTYLLAAKIAEDVADEIDQLRLRACREPSIYILKIGQNAFLASHVNNKQQSYAVVGIQCTVIHFNEDVPAELVIGRIIALNQDPEVDGIMIQLPMPPHISGQIVNVIDPRKDIAYMHPSNHIQGRKSGFAWLLEHGCQVQPRKTAIIIGGNLDANALHMLSHLPADKTIGVIGHPNLLQVVREADLLILSKDTRWRLNWDLVRDDAVIFDLAAYDMSNVFMPNDNTNVPATVAQLIEWFMPLYGGNGPLAIALSMRNALSARLDNELMCNEQFDRGIFPMFRKQSSLFRVPSRPLVSGYNNQADAYRHAHVREFRNSLS